MSLRERPEKVMLLFKFQTIGMKLNFNINPYLVGKKAN